MRTSRQVTRCVSLLKLQTDHYKAVGSHPGHVRGMSPATRRNCLLRACQWTGTSPT